jgi:hypothetical protein
MSITTITPELQASLNIDRIKNIHDKFHAELKREELMAQIFDDSDKAQELDFDNEDLH